MTAITLPLPPLILRFAAALGLSPESDRLNRLFDRTVADHDQMIRRICLGYAHTPQDLEDLYQEVLINIWNGLPSFREESTMRTWVYRVALNSCVSSLRLRGRAPSFASLDDVIVVPDDSQEKRESIKELYECIATLNPVDKAIVMMWLDGYSYDEIAEVVGLRRNAVATRLHRAKSRLRTYYQQS